MKVKALVTAAIGAALISSVASAAELRLSHQWSTKDVRHKVAEIVANHVKAIISRTTGYDSSSIILCRWSATLL